MDRDLEIARLRTRLERIEVDLRALSRIAAAIVTGLIQINELRARVLESKGS